MAGEQGRESEAFRRVVSDTWSVPLDKVVCTFREQKPGELAVYTLPCRNPGVVQVIPCPCGLLVEPCHAFHPPSFRCARHVVVDLELALNAPARKESYRG